MPHSPELEQEISPEELEKLINHPICIFWGRTFPSEAQVVKILQHTRNPKAVREAANGRRPAGLPEEIWRRIKP